MYQGTVFNNDTIYCTCFTEKNHHILETSEEDHIYSALFVINSHYILRQPNLHT